MRVLLLLLAPVFADLARAQCSCSMPVRTATYSLPPTHYPMCHPPPTLQSMMAPCYQPQQQIVVPLPPPPKGCSSAKTTVQQQPIMMPQAGHYPFHPGPSHPPICVQSVYVGKKEDDEKDCKKKGKKGDVEPEGRRRRRARRQRRRYIDPAILRSLLGVDPEDPCDPSDPSDPSDTCDSCDQCLCNSSPRIVYIDNQ